jgi:GNAT superfamily N-acetyltransferase
MNITIRALRPQDRHQWEALWRGYQQFYHADLSTGTESLWTRLMAPPKDGPFCIVAALPVGGLAGIAQYLFHASTWSETPRCYLNDLFTAEAMRGQGVARKLIEAVYQAADERGAPQVYWLTQEDNRTARALYDKVADRTPFIKYAR